MRNKDAPKWKREMWKYDKNTKQEESRNRQAIIKLKDNAGHSDGADNQTYSINSLSGDPTLERELKQWRKALREFRKIGD